jgi:hypothetical protein
MSKEFLTMSPSADWLKQHAEFIPSDGDLVHAKEIAKVANHNLALSIQVRSAALDALWKCVCNLALYSYIAGSNVIEEVKLTLGIQQKGTFENMQKVAFAAIRNSIPLVDEAGNMRAYNDVYQEVAKRGMHVAKEPGTST